ncbi:methylenetetrahydrofolate reductase isoform X4 [Exaiptasia diaphana]|uniref:MTHFR SAM-binding regulatory domain-containing protein n=1 Tax=Exaiptasia diaphana TaxID=2652724 RepID=A0A913Y577_EXADI|nr:methylenetetrahydrofolate reductase isoform X3 [Exaiptasia diaphana]XP_020914598.1 methylenetetrahydrofolate reductase isoform X4 [Exaiptasia diaphana]
MEKTAESTQEEPSIPKLLEKINHHIQKDERFFSAEFFPPKTFNGATNLCAILYRLYESQTIPLFVDVTWKASEDPLSDSCREPTALLMCAASRQVNRFDTMIHIPFMGTTKTQVYEHLLKAKELGVGGIRALRKGSSDQENATNQDSNDAFSSVEELIKFVKREFKDQFAIAVTGFLSESKDKEVYDDDLGKLKREIEAGANFITTQMFFEAESFFKFVKDCRNIGIKVPIIPGILPIQNLSSLRQLKKNASVNIPQHIFDALLPIKDETKIIDYGVKYTTELCQKLLAHPEVPGIHFYTLNVEKPLKRILGNLNMTKNLDDTVMFPWQHNDVRLGDDVRPIFWATRPRSYLIRTSEWDDLPNGRWGFSSSASFGDLKDYHLFLLGKQKDEDELLSMWGRELKSVKDVAEIFVCYLTGKDNKHGHKVTELPWVEEELANETIPMVDELAEINKHGILTINSQPCVNAVPSDDCKVGWGKPGGYVFQKAYIEFFANEEIAHELYKQLKESKRINFHIVNCSGDDDVTNADVMSPIAVTWGVFPGSEVIQPTVVDPIAFQFWKDEAFSLWKQQWGRLYPEGSKSRDIINSIHDTYYLVNLVDNDYIAGNSLFDIINNVIEIVNERNGDHDRED